MKKFIWQTTVNLDYIQATASKICADIFPDRKLKIVDITNA